MSFAVPHDAVLVADGGLATELEARGTTCPTRCGRRGC
jgi:S-methylmethionine-dependent homocysteine/selenocysteine methylase